MNRIAKNQHNIFVELEPVRGTIYDRNMRKLAFNIAVDSVWANPRDIKEKEKVSELLSPILKIEKSQILQKLQKDKGFIWLSRKVPPDSSLKIKGLKLKGIELIKESKRCYPNNELAAQLIGFSGLDNNGLEGLEIFFDNFLRGKEGYKLSSRDAKGREIPSGISKIALPTNGLNLVLTIDEIIQNISEKALKKAYEKHNAKGAMLVMIDPQSGEILALANQPGFNLNNFKNSNPENRRNRCVTDFFEPGSVFKIVTASALLEKNLIGLNDMIFCENGEYPIRGHILHDHRPHGNLSFQEVIEQSSNIGTIKAASRLKESDMYNYAKAFGFGSATGIEMPGEVEGVLRPVKYWSKTSMTAIPMGQELTVTSLQLADSISAIANGGVLMKPYVIKKIIDGDGEVLKEIEPQKVQAVISSKTSATMRKVLYGVVEKGTGKKALMSDYTCGGKTGTAQKVEPNGTFSHSKFVATFIGFAPVDNPRIAMAISFDEPHPVYFGGDVAAPVFREVCDQTLRYLGVPPDKHGKIDNLVYSTQMCD